MITPSHQNYHQGQGWSFLGVNGKAPDHQGHEPCHQSHREHRDYCRGDIPQALGVFHLLVEKGGALPLQAVHLFQQRGGVQVVQPLVPVAESAAELDGLLQIFLIPLQGDQMAAHAIAHGVGTRLHLADFLQRDAQLAQQLYLPQLVHLPRAVLPVAIFAVAPGGDESLLLVEANVLFGDAHLGLHLIDFHRLFPLCSFSVYLPQGGRSRFFCVFSEKGSPPPGGGLPAFILLHPHYP